MRVTLLGCGTSSGVPRIGNDWGRCDPAEPRNHRLRAALAVTAEGTTVLVDTGPDLRAQLLAAKLGRLDAVIWTHEHADHTNGIDDLRQVFHLRGSPVPGYARDDTAALLRHRFRYVFEGRPGYPPTATLTPLTDELTIGGLHVAVVDQPHGSIEVAGLRFTAGGKSVGYATDCSAITPEMRAFFHGVDLWIVDALRHAPHPTHTNLAMVLAAVPVVKPRRTVLTHMDQSMDYATLRAELPKGVEPGYDNMVVEL